MKNVLVVSQPGTDGVLRHVDLLCRYLLRHGVRLHLAYSDLQTCERLRDLVKHVAACGGKTLNLRTGNAPQGADLPALFALWRLIREVQPQVIHAHSSKAGGLVRALGLLGLRIPIFYTPHAYYRMHHPKHWKARVFHCAERWLGKVGTSIGNGTFEFEFARDTLRVSPSKCVTIPNGIDTNAYGPGSAEEKRTLREKFRLPAEGLLLGTVGRLSLQKDPDTMYRALANVLAQSPDLSFVHLGRGELEPEVDSFLAGQPFAHRIKRIPYLANSIPFYQMLDGFLLTSRYEGQSYAALEAFACDLPAVLTDAPGNTDLADYGFSHVWRAVPGDADSVAEAILAWRDSARSGIRPNHRELMVKLFDERICNSRIMSAYEEAVSREAGCVSPVTHSYEEAAAQHGS